MFKKLLASVGIGAAKVDTLILSETLVPGETMLIEIVIEGGDVPQTINGLELSLMTMAEVEHEGGESRQPVRLHHWHLDDRFTVAANERRSERFELTLPLETPITALRCTRGFSEVWLETGLDIAQGLDGRDHDPLRIAPTAAMSQVLAAVEACGFELYSTDVEQGQLRGPNFASSLGCYQELEFRPTGMGAMRVKEVEVSFVAQPGVTHVMLEVDRRFAGDSLRCFAVPEGASDSEVAMSVRQILG
ncbi:SpoOM family protein [Ferrimonas balearica DSM 9799]|uniref:SpoOM family protein n=1 Tax=Ferrimonas balearica (strain DSM 9799 / CCM 4581 / KCTC 23876 / PAT) TaxID=550540 RepID=E1SSB8_FERBD|nr:sporulation protein [Ferrimonas balearica]ADN77050.1 SpoOM family protein [Ferrimonas balearica DSM 9799]MBY5980153.1 sporulation protein [Ferrimonas balearica]